VVVEGVSGADLEASVNSRLKRGEGSDDRPDIVGEEKVWTKKARGVSSTVERRSSAGISGNGTPGWGHLRAAE